MKVTRVTQEYFLVEVEDNQFIEEAMAVVKLNNNTSGKSSMSCYPITLDMAARQTDGARWSYPLASGAIT